MNYQPGPELNALVAERVMGFQVEKSFTFPYELVQIGRVPSGEPLLAYSTDIAAAWLVVEKLAPHIAVAMFNGKWCATSDTFGSTDSWDYIEGESAPHAICLAALKAVQA